MLLLAGFGALVLGLALLTLVGSRGFAFDFAAYHAAAARIASGASPYLPETVGGPFSPGPFGLYLYPPPFAVLLVPLLALPFQTAAVLFLAARVALLAAACAILPVPRVVRAATFAVAAVSQPVLSDLNLGNVSIIVLFLGAAAWRWIDRPAGAVALAAGILLRAPLAIVLAWWALRRRPLPIAWTLGALVVVTVATLPVVGLPAYFDYLSVVRNLSDVTTAPRNVSLGATAVALGLAVPVPTLATLAGVAIAVAAMVLSLRRDRELGLIVTLTGTLLLAPLLWGHYLTALLLPAAFLASRGRRWGLALPLLGWLPELLLPIAAVAGTVAPFGAAPKDAARDGEARGIDALAQPASESRT